MLSRAQNTFHHNPRLRGPVSSNVINLRQYIHRYTVANSTWSYTVSDKWFYAAGKRLNAVGRLWRQAQHTTFLLSF